MVDDIRELRVQMLAVVVDGEDAVLRVVKRHLRLHGPIDHVRDQHLISDARFKSPADKMCNTVTRPVLDTFRHYIEYI